MASRGKPGQFRGRQDVTAPTVNATFLYLV